MEGFSALIALIILTTIHADRGRIYASSAQAASFSSVHQQTNEDIRGAWAGCRPKLKDLMITN